MVEILLEKKSAQFVGYNAYTLDSKNRAPVFPDFLRVLDTAFKDEHRNVIISLSLNLSIAVYPIRIFEEFLTTLQEKSLLNRNMLKVMTMIEGTAYQQVVDSQGRLRLNEEVLTYAGIPPRPVEEKGGANVTISRLIDERGFRTRFEIWSPERWKNFIAETTSKIDEIKDALSK